MHRRLGSFATAVLLGVLSACTTGGRVLPKTPLETLTAARAALDDEKPARAKTLLDRVDETEYRGEDFVRYKVLLAEALLGVGEPYDAFLAVEKLPTDYPTSVWRPDAERLEFEAGRRLSASGWTFLGLASDLADAQRVLRHFVTYWPRSTRIPEALRILGEAAYVTGDYEFAIHRFTQLVQLNPSPELVDLAAARIAMSHYKQVRGASYDGGQMARAREELVNYLQRARDPARIEEARTALAQILAWQEIRALQVARFYLTVSRPQAAIQRLEALVAQVDLERRDEATALLARARDMLASLPKDESDAAQDKSR